MKWVYSIPKFMFVLKGHQYTNIYITFQAKNTIGNRFHLQTLEINII